MTPEDISYIESDAAHVLADADAFATTFYDNVFEIAPATRAMFPDDLSDQRKKLLAELKSMIGAAIAHDDPVALDRFLDRTRKLGARHVGYGVTEAMYAPVGAALIGALRVTVPDFDEDHERAWTAVYQLIATTMQEGAAAALATTPA